MSAKDVLLHATIERERGKADYLTAEIRKTITDLRAEGDRLFEQHGAAEAREVWLMAKRLERSLRRSTVKRELVPV